MVGDMKSEEPSLTRYLVKHLKPLTEADPAILAEYVMPLLEKDKPMKKLQKLCTDNLVEFLGDGSTKLDDLWSRLVSRGLLFKPKFILIRRSRKEATVVHLHLKKIRKFSSRV